VWGWGEEEKKEAYMENQELTDEQIERAKRFFKAIQVRAQLRGWGWLQEQDERSA